MPLPEFQLRLGRGGDGGGGSSAGPAMRRYFARRGAVLACVASAFAFLRQPARRPGGSERAALAVAAAAAASWLKGRRRGAERGGQLGLCGITAGRQCAGRSGSWGPGYGGTGLGSFVWPLLSLPAPLWPSPLFAARLSDLFVVSTCIPVLL